MSTLIIQPAKSLSGTLCVPGDKSISHRALLMGVIAEGPFRILNCLESEDVKRTLKAVQTLGVPVRREGEVIFLQGRGGAGLVSPGDPLEMGNSGTTTRLMLGLLAGLAVRASLVGDLSLSKRPMRRVVDPLEQMGAKIQSESGGEHLPLTVQGGDLRGIEYTLPVPSAQVKSALLLAGLGAKSETTIHEPVPTRDHTERILSFFGGELKTGAGAVRLSPGKKLTAKDLQVPGDFSSAAFFLAAAAMAPGASVTVTGVGLNRTRTEFLTALQEMGAKVKLSGQTHSDWEPWGDVTVSHGSLKGISLSPERIPGMIDELPVLMAAATQAEGATRIQGAGEVRVKETDRIESMVAGLRAMGADIRADGETLFIRGPSRLKGARLEAFGDHRTAMALAVAALCAEGETAIRGAEWVDISFPGFARSLESLRG